MVFQFKDTLNEDMNIDNRFKRAYQNKEYNKIQKFAPYKPEFNKIDNLLNSHICVKKTVNKYDESYDIRAPVKYNGRTDIILPNLSRDLKFWKLSC